MTTKKSKKRTTKPKPQGTETEQTPGQKYEEQLRQILDAWPEKALQLLAADVLALEATEGARKIKPGTSDAALLRRLGPIGGDAVKGWIVLPARPPAPQMPETLKGRTQPGLDKAGFYDSEGQRIG